MKKISTIILAIIIIFSSCLTHFQVQAAEIKTFQVQVGETINGTVTIKNTNSKYADLEVGENVYLVIESNEKFELKELEVKTESGRVIQLEQNNVFSMPDENCVIKSTFGEITQKTEQVIEKKTVPEETTPETITPEEITPEETTPGETTPEETTPEEITPEEITPEETTPEEITLEDINEDKQIVTKATARGTGIEYFGTITYSGTTVGAFTINGNIAFCMEHLKTTPDTGTAFTESVYNNADIRKVLYYGWGGTEQWSGFSTYEQGVVVTSLALSYYYSGSDTIGMQKHGTSSQRIGLSDFFNFIEAKADIPTNKITLSKSSSESYLTVDKTMQRSDEFTLQADSRNSITISLEKGMALVNVSASTTNTGNVVVKGGETFYLTAPLTMNSSWESGSLVSSMPKFNAILATTASSGLQDIGYVLWATDPTNTVSLTVNWKAIGYVSVKKVDAETGLGIGQGTATLAGAEYTLFTNQACTTVAKDISGNDIRFITDSNGMAPKSNGIVFGTYYLKETKAPSGYLLNDEVITITLPETDSDPFDALVTSKDKPKRGDFEIIKYAQPAMEEEVDLQKPLAGVEFTLEHHKTGEKVVIVTDEKGKANTVDKNFPNGRLLYGKWTVSETGVPEGFTAIKPFVIDIENQGDFHSYIAENKRIRSAIRIVKVDSMTQQPIGLKHMEFKIVNTDTNKDVVFTQRYPSNEKIIVLTTDKNGACILPQKLDYGNYALVEITAPEGYLNNKVQVPFKVDSSFDWEKPLVVQVENENVMGTISINKNDETTGNPIANTEFSLYAKQDIITNDGTTRHYAGDFIETLKTNIMGTATTSKLYLGLYEVVETKQTPGYLLEERRYTVALKYKDQNTALVTESLEVLNKPTTLIINKMDLDSSKPLENVKFKFSRVEDKDAIDSEYLVAESFSTDAEGNIVIKNLVEGVYHLIEEETLDGYVLDQTLYEITVNNRGEFSVKKDQSKEHVGSEIISDSKEQLTIILKNDITKVEFSKQDISTEKELPGAHLKLTDKDGELVEEWISSDKPYLIKNLIVGEEYTLTETIAPKGYLIAQDIKFTIDNTREIQKVVMKDQYSVGYIKPFMDKGKNNGFRSVITGDTTNIIIYALLLIFGIFGAVFSLRRKKISHKKYGFFCVLLIGTLLLNDFSVMAKETITKEKEVTTTESAEKDYENPFQHQIIEKDKEYTLKNVTYNIVDTKHTKVKTEVTSDVMETDAAYTPEPKIIQEGVEYDLLETVTEEAILKGAQDQVVSAYTDYDYTITASDVPATKTVTVVNQVTGKEEDIECELESVGASDVKTITTPMTIVFYDYDSKYFQIGPTLVEKNEEVPPLKGYEPFLLTMAGATQNDVITNIYWSGGSYENNGQLCRNAIADVQQTITVYRADYRTRFNTGDVKGVVYKSTYEGVDTNGKTEYKIKATATYESVKEKTSLLPLYIGIGVLIGIGLIILILYIISKKKKTKENNNKQNN